MNKISSYLSLIKFSHTIFALPFALISFFYAIYLNHKFDYLKLILIILCMVFARSAAMAFNRYIDFNFDRLNPRTQQREIPAGKISKKSALIFIIVNSFLFVLTTYFINQICFYLSFIALFVVLGYSYTKRFTPLCHLILGVGLSLSPIGSYLAVTGKFEVVPFLLGVIVFFWVSGFDIIYALQDIEFDISQNLYSIPSVLGAKKALYLSRFFHFISVCIIWFLGFYADFNILYFIGSFIFSFLLYFQHRLVKIDDLSKVNLAFAVTNGFASLIYSVFVILNFCI